MSRGGGPTSVSALSGGQWARAQLALDSLGSPQSQYRYRPRLIQPISRLSAFRGARPQPHYDKSNKSKQTPDLIWAV